MPRKLVFPALLLLAIAVSAWLLWNRGSGSRSHRTPGDAPASRTTGRMESGEHTPAHARERKESPTDEPADVDSIGQLETLAQINPGLIDKLSLPLFQRDMEAVSAAWELLGVEKAKVDALSKDLKGVFAEMREQEGRDFTVLNQSEEMVDIGLPFLSPEEGARRTKQIEDAFAQVMGPELSKHMARRFIGDQDAIAAGMHGQNRVVRIRPTSPDIASATGEKYEITIYVLAGENKYSPGETDWPRYSGVTTTEMVKEIPAHWSHLFGKPD